MERGGEMKLPPQERRIYDYLRAFDSITPMSAWQACGVYRLSSVIHKLRGRGIQIKTETAKAKNRFGEPVNFARYFLEPQKGA